MKNIILTTLLLLSLFNLQAQKVDTNEDNLWDVSLEDLMNVEVKLATKKSVSLRETPAIVTVISKEDIQNSGVKDLKEILELFVPGFQFGVDVEGVVSASVRGMWASEGKFLLMIDGLECNEEMFSSVPFINHYTVDNIEKIEISRGPGSAIYGGYASLSVINIITKGASDSYASMGYSQMDESYAQRYGNLNIGKKIGDFSINLNGAYSQGVKSQLDNIDYFQNSMPMKGNSDINTTFANLNIKYKGLNVRAIADQYHYEQIDLWGANHSVLNQKSDTYLGEISYKIKINSKQSLTPKIVYKYQLPWNLDVPDEMYENSKFVTKYQGGLTHSWDITKKISLLTGVEYFNSIINLPANHKEYESLFKNGTNKLAISNISAYSQAIIFNKIVNVTLGGRYDLSSEFGSSFVPRLAFTKAFDKVHFKAMLSQSFRVPGGMLPDRVPEGVAAIQPEKATNYEFEVGYNISNFYFGVNAFAITFDKVIVYGSDPETGLGTYQNAGKFNTNGLEAEMKFRWKKINFMMNYAYHFAGKSDVTSFIVPDNEKYLLAFSPHRLNSMLNLRINKLITFNILGSFYGNRFGYTHNDNLGNAVLTEFKPELLLNANLRFTNILKTKLYATIGVSNILDSKLPIIQPYQGDHAPLPSLSRALSIKLMYNFKI